MWRTSTAGNVFAWETVTAPLNPVPAPFSSWHKTFGNRGRCGGWKQIYSQISRSRVNMGPHSASSPCFAFSRTRTHFCTIFRKVRPSHAVSFFTSVVTASSICLSVRPSNDWLFSFPRSAGVVCQFRCLCLWKPARRGEAEDEIDAPYLAYTFGVVPPASRRRMGVFGLFFFMVG